MLRGEAFLEFDELANHNAGTNNTHLKFIQEGLLGGVFNKCPFQAEVRDVPRYAETLRPPIQALLCPPHRTK